MEKTKGSLTRRKALRNGMASSRALTAGSPAAAAANNRTTFAPQASRHCINPVHADGMSERHEGDCVWFPYLHKEGNKG
jgi:hypothetical protein